MDPHLLRTFVAVARHESFSVAATELGYTQSAVSQQIAALEADLGVPLLHRRPVTPTDAGHRLLEHAGPILLRLDAARADIRRISGAQPIDLRVGISPMADGSRLAEVLVAVQRSTPHVTVTLSVCVPDDVAAGVARGEFEIGLVDGVAAPSDPLRLVDLGTLTTAVVAESPLVVVLPRDHPLATRAALRLGDLADALWIDAPAAAVPLARLRAIADGFRSGLAYDGAERSVLLAVVAAGGGLAVLPAKAVRDLPSVVAGPLAQAVRDAPGVVAGPPAEAVRDLPSVVAGPLAQTARDTPDVVAVPPAQAVPDTPGVVAVPLADPAPVHRTELVHGSLTGPAAAIVAQLRWRTGR